MNNIEIAKKAVTIVVGFGASKIAASIIKNNVATETVIQKVTVTSAAVVIGMMASDATSKFTESKINEIVAKIEAAKIKINEANKTKEV